MYKGFNDYELLYMIREDSDFDILYKKYQPLIYKLVKSYQRLFKKFGYEIDDLMQIGYLTLYKASYLYNYNNSLFYTYFISSLKRALISEFRKNDTFKKKCLNEAFSYDNLIPNTNISYIDIIPCKEKIDYIEERKRFVYFKNSLSFIGACLFEMLYNGFPYNEIMIILDEDKKSILKYLKEIRNQKKVQCY